MREFSVPVTTEVQPDAALTDMLARNVAEHGSRGRPAAAARRPVAGRHLAAVRRGGARGRQGAHRLRCGRRRPRRPAGQDPLRVDRLRLRDLDRRRGRGPGLRDQQRRPGRLDPVRLGRHRHRRGEQRARHRRGVRARPGAGPRVRPRHRRRRRRRPDRRGQGRPRLRAGRAPGHPERRQPGDADLHQRHHRPAQGLRAHPRELPVRDRERHHAARPVHERAGLAAAVHPAGPRARPRPAGRRRSTTARSSGTPRT